MRPDSRLGAAADAPKRTRFGGSLAVCTLRGRLLVVWVMAFAMLLTGCVSGRAAESAPDTFHVSVGGSDSGDGSAGRPWRTLQRAVDAAPAGATVVVRPGTYDGFALKARHATLSLRGAPDAPRPVVAASGGARAAIQLEDVRGLTVEHFVVEGVGVQWGAGVLVRSSAEVTLADLVARGNRSFGVLIEDSTHVRMHHSQIYDNETGVQVSRDGAGVVISANEIHDNNRLIVNDPEPGNDRGANAVVFYRTTGPVTATRNRIWSNRGRSTDYGFDGGAFEIYDSSRVTISRNTVSNNQNVLETGSGGSLGCQDNRFVRNVAYAGAATGPVYGLILRCAERMLVANNTFDGLERFTYDLNAEAAAFGGSIDGLRVVNNVATSSADKIYSIDSALPSSVVVDRNLAFNRSGGYLAYVAGHGNTRDLAALRAQTGLERTGLVADPRFVAGSRRDYRVRPDSPTIDRGLRIAGVTVSIRGHGPDLGARESH